jgi:hypothetical protein
MICLVDSRFVLVCLHCGVPGFTTIDDDNLYFQPG